MTSWVYSHTPKWLSWLVIFADNDDSVLVCIRLRLSIHFSFLLFSFTYAAGHQPGVPYGAARQNTRSSGRIWASWKKNLGKLAGWEIWMSASLAENMKNSCRFWLDKKVYFFALGNLTVIFYMDIRASEASKCAWKSPHEGCRNDTFCL